MITCSSDGVLLLLSSFLHQGIGRDFVSSSLSSVQPPHRVPVLVLPNDLQIFPEPGMLQVFMFRKIKEHVGFVFAPKSATKVWNKELIAWGMHGQIVSTKCNEEPQHAREIIHKSW